MDLGNNPKEALKTLHQRLDLIYAGLPKNHPVDRVLSQIVVDHDLPRGLLDALLEGFDWDSEERTYETLEEVCNYGARVAGTVGVMMAILMGVEDRDALARAADLGVAMQLTNICRDVGEDARAGRLYLPRQLLRKEGIKPEAFLASPEPSPGLTRVLKILLEHAERLYQRADQGIEELPISCRPGIRAARRLYAEIGHTLAEGNYDPISVRSIVSRSKKIKLLAGVMIGASKNKKLLAEQCADENRFLLRSIPKTRISGRENPRKFSPSASWILELFMVLEKREKLFTNNQQLDLE